MGLLARLALRWRSPASNSASRSGMLVDDAMSAPDFEHDLAALLDTGIKDRMAALRAELSPEDQTLLTLRVDRDLPWGDVADILDEAEPALRKRFERLKLRLRELARTHGLLPGGDEPA
jgi:DNA-directed RNA polymerase specialized sigma24 family protein